MTHRRVLAERRDPGVGHRDSSEGRRRTKADHRARAGGAGASNQAGGKRGIRPARLRQQVKNELTVVAHEYQFTRDAVGTASLGRLCDGPIDVGPDGGIGVTAGAGERTC